MRDHEGPAEVERFSAPAGPPGRDSAPFPGYLRAPHAHEAMPADVSGTGLCL